jgi:mRNA degradation ribonuclease J1/J2
MAHLVEEGNRRKYMHSTSQSQLQDKIWAGAEPIFGINRQQIISTKNYLTQHLGTIAADNLKGQCTKGHSCKQEAKTMLRRIVNQST